MPSGNSTAHKDTGLESSGTLVVFALRDLKVVDSLFPRFLSVERSASGWPA